MIRRLLVLAFVLGLVFAPVAQAELQFYTTTITTTSVTRTIGYGTLVVINDGASDLYIRVFWEGEDSADATAASTLVKSGESFTFAKSLSIASISMKSASSSTVRLVYW